MEVEKRGTAKRENGVMPKPVRQRGSKPSYKKLPSNPIKWFGGKFYLAKKIIELFPPHTRYVEPYFGGGSVLLNKTYEGVSEYANDINGELTNFWKVLRCSSLFQDFVIRANMTPFSEYEFNRARVTDGIGTEISRALKFFVRYRMSRQGLGLSYATPTARTRRGMNEQVSAYLSAVEGLPQVHERLKRVEIWNRPALDCIRQLDSCDTLYYLDPTYLEETREAKQAYGLYEMSSQDHKELLNLLSEISGKFVLSGYPSDMYERARLRNNWKVEQIEIDNKASSRKNKPKQIECLWYNF